MLVHDNGIGFTQENRDSFDELFFVDESMRFKGLGKIMMAYISRLAVERGCQRLERACLDWNQPTIAFYKGLGAYSVDGMSIYRFAPDVLQANAALF